MSEILYVLDTNIVSEPAKPHPSESVMARLADFAENLSLPSPAWHELNYGAHRLDDGKRKDYLIEYLRETVLASMPIRPCGSKMAWTSTSRA